MNMLSGLFKGLIYFYQYAISPFIAGRCRFTPTCSSYAIEAIDRFGPFKGGWLSVRRFCRCHPWGGHGHDPVPLSNKSTK